MNEEEEDTVQTPSSDHQLAAPMWGGQAEPTYEQLCLWDEDDYQIMDS